MTTTSLVTGVIVISGYESKVKSMLLGAMLVTGLGNIVFTCLGIIAIKTKNKDWLKFFFIGSIILLIFVLLYTIFIFVFFTVIIENIHHELLTLNLVITPILTVNGIVFVVIANAYQKIVELDLLNYYIISD